MGSSRSRGKASVQGSKKLQEPGDQITHLLKRLQHAKLTLACVARGCLAIFTREDLLYKHIRDIQGYAHIHCAEFLNINMCEICGEVQRRIFQHHYSHHPFSYQVKIRKLIGYDIPTGVDISPPPKCFDIAFVIKYCTFSDGGSDSR
jgi:hypothetical protein